MGSRQAGLYRRCWLYTSLVAGTLYHGFRDTHGVDALAVGLPQPVGIWALVIPPHFFDRPTLAVDGFIDIVGHNWPETPKLRTPMHKTVIQRGLPPRWLQISQVAWAGEKCKVFSGDKEALSGNTGVSTFLYHLRSSRAAQGNRLPGGSLITVAAILVRIHAERNGGDWVLVYFNIFILHVHFFQAARGTPVCRRISTHSYGDFGSHTPKWSSR